MVEVDQSGGERATIQAVATRAGVSSTTVSLVLAGKASLRRISEGTHGRVLRAAEELNYAPNLGTRTLRGGRTNILSFFNSYRNRDRNDLYMNALSSAVEAAGGAEGYDILVHCNFERDLKAVYQFLNGGLADGLLLFAPREDDPLLDYLRKSSLPVAILNGRDPLGRYDSVADDVAQGMGLVVEALLEQGHRDIAAFVDGETHLPDSERRLDLLRRLLAERGVDLASRRVLGANERNAGNVLARLRTEGLPTAIFCWHDRLAYALASACAEQKVRVPQDLSIVSYDGLHWPSRSPHEVASVKVDLDGLATAAVRLLHRPILSPGGSVTHGILPVSFVRGTTLGPASPATVQNP